MNNRLTITTNDVHIPPENSQCKTCAYRDKTGDEGWMKITCKKYAGISKKERKPFEVRIKNERCEFYKSEK